MWEGTVKGEKVPVYDWWYDQSLTWDKWGSTPWDTSCKNSAAVRGRRRRGRGRFYISSVMMYCPIHCWLRQSSQQLSWPMGSTTSWSFLIDYLSRRRDSHTEFRRNVWSNTNQQESWSIAQLPICICTQPICQQRCNHCNLLQLPGTSGTSNRQFLSR